MKKYNDKNFAIQDVSHSFRLALTHVRNVYHTVDSFQIGGMRVLEKDLLLTPHTRGAAACTAWMFRKGWVMYQESGKWVRSPIAFGQLLTNKSGLSYAVLLVHQTNVSTTTQE